MCVTCPASSSVRCFCSYIPHLPAPPSPCLKLPHIDPPVQGLLGGLDSTRVYKCKYKYPTRTPNSRCRGTREQSALVRLIRFRANLYSQLPNIAFVSLNSTHYSLCVCPIQTPPPTPYSSFCTKMILWTAVIGVFTFIVSLTPVAANSPISVSYRRRPPAAGRLLTTCTVS